jgi:hypothetical protein
MKIIVAEPTSEFNSDSIGVILNHYPIKETTIPDSD